MHESFCGRGLSHCASCKARASSAHNGKKKKGGGSSSTPMTVPIGTSIQCRKCFCQLCSVALCFEARASSARLQKKKKKKKLTLSRKIGWRECVHAMCEAVSVRGMCDCGSVMGDSNQRGKNCIHSRVPDEGKSQKDPARPARQPKGKGGGWVPKLPNASPMRPKIMASCAFHSSTRGRTKKNARSGRIGIGETKKGDHGSDAITTLPVSVETGLKRSGN